MDNRRRMMWKKPPEYAIYYTSTDGNIVTPYSSATWGGAKIMSNTYENGEGKIVFDKKVTHVYNSFRNCNTLKTITIPDSVISIGNNSFQDCTSLTSITIGNGVTSILYNAFYNCKNLIRVDTSSIYNWCRISFMQYTGYLFYYNAQLYINGKIIDDVIIPSGVSRINTYAFYKQPITSLTIPDSVTEIGQHVFCGCTSMKRVTIGNGVTEIGVSAFEDCTSLISVYITDIAAWCNISFGNNPFSNPLRYAGNLYLNNELVTDLIIPDGATKISSYAFCYCTSLTSVTIPNSVTSIGFSAFNNCTSLTSVTIGNGITSIGSYAFSYCDSLTSVTIGNGITSIGEDAFTSCTSLTSIIIPDSVTEIGDKAFKSCTSLTSFYGKFSSDDRCCLIVDGRLVAFAPACGKTSYIIPDSVTSIGKYAFYNCTSLTSVVIPDSVTEIGEGAFEGCHRLTSVTIGNGVTSIAYRAFFGCSSLTSVTIGNSVTEIGNMVFYNCRRLASITIPDSVTSIGDMAFYYCINLTSIVIPDGVTSIGSQAFYNCSSLTSVTIGKSVISIGSQAFRCSSLTSVISKNTVSPSIQSNTFNGVKRNGTLYYPAGSDYSSWLSTSSYYLGYSGWTSQWIYTPQTYYDLSITAQDVIGNYTTTTISWTCMSDGIDNTTGETLTGIQLSGTAISEEFPQNTSETETVERTITFEYQGLTASTTITQGVWINQSYELVLNDNWQLSTAVTNPDSALYDGVYESFSNYNVGSTAAIMYIDISGYETFQLYIRSYAESSYDYVMVSQIDQTIDNNSSYSNTTLVKAHTRGTQKSGTTISDYTLVEFTGLDRGEHRITVVYRKDGSGNSGTDKGYLIIPRQ